jgi:hypothetical protein
MTEFPTRQFKDDGPCDVARLVGFHNGKLSQSSMARAKLPKDHDK